jgi:hypothetical protein
MTQPQSDPAQDVPAALARIAEQTVGLQRQIKHLEDATRNRADMLNEHLSGRIDNLAELTEAKFITYRTLVDAQAAQVALALDASKEAINKAEAATNKAIEKAAEATERRFESVNEFRQTLSDQAGMFMPRSEASQLIAQMTQRTREIADQIPNLMTRTEATAIGARNAERIDEVKSRQDRMEGQDTGTKDNKTSALAIVSMLIGIAGLAVAAALALTR